MNPRSLLRGLVACAALAAAVASAPAQAQDFSRYVSLGDSLTAGFMSAGLIDEVQRNDYPALLAKAMGKTDFQQPLVSSPGIPALLDLVSARPVLIRAVSGQGRPTNLTLARPYDNLAVPGFRVHDVRMNPTTNPLVSFILRPTGFQNASALQQALLLRPTFVSLWIGNNDVLGAATSGIVIDGVTLTPVAQFEADLRAIVGALRGAGAQLVMANIPDVGGIPFVKTIPPVVVNPATNQPVLVNGAPVRLIGPNGPLALTDRVLLTASAVLATGTGIPRGIGNGNGNPLGDQYVLNGAEQAAISARVAAYNNVIQTVANEAGAALVDMHRVFDEVANEGLEIAGVNFSEDFLTGGVFSYDGVHPTPFGYAFIANEFIKAINAKFGSKLQQVDLFPFTFGPTGAAGTFEGISAATGQLVYGNAAYEQLRRSLNVPPTKTLLDLARRQPHGNGGGGGNPG
ncbi:MAG TPA: GDSL-type esterase/lipase family protein, partial [Thermoanaerobaculia bacterium]|nr:GDSL-type esterase/lipase family protein [Thermoanaerobaculia bacterium]